MRTTNKTRTARSTIIIGMFLIHAVAAAGWAGEIVAWGYNDHYEVRPLPVGDDFVAVAAGCDHNVALRSDGSLLAWGATSDTPAGNDFVAVTAGYSHSVALKSDGRLVAWGAGTYGQVSDTPAGNDFEAVSAGLYHNVALKSDGSLVSWGRDNTGQVSNTPAGNNFVAVDAGFYHSVAIKSDGSLVAWGIDNYGQVSKTPKGTGFKAVSAGWSGSVALKSDGSLVSWGSDNYGLVSNTPGGNNFVAVSAGGDYNVALTSDGRLSAWGSDKFDKLKMTPRYDDFIAVSAGRDHNVAIRDTQTIPIPAVSIAATDASAGEPANDGYFTVSRTGDTSASLLVYYSTSGSTASAEADYKALPGYVSIPAGKSSASIPVDVIDDSTVESSETVRLTISSNAAYNVGSPSSATVTITDDDDIPVEKPVVTITATDASAAEPANDGFFTVSRAGDTSGNLVVYYSTSGSTASAGSDYAALTGYAYISSGQSSAVVSVDVVDDTTVESSETVRLTISSNAAYSIGSPSYATVTITDDDDQPPVDETVVTITATDASAGEPSNDGSFTISRTGDTSTSLRVYCTTSGSTASSGADYVAIPYCVDIPSGQSSASIPVVVIDDLITEDSETVQLTVRSISSFTQYVTGSPSSATVTITDNDGTPVEKPVVTITALDASAAEPYNDGAFTISRTGDTSSDLLVYYSTGGSATAGADYKALSGYVDIPSGQSWATIDVIVIDDSSVESSETVLLTISSNAAYSIGSPSYATVTITDDDVLEPPVVDVEQMMAKTLAFFYDSYDDGSLVSVGTWDLYRLRWTLESAYDRIVDEDYDDACVKLWDALSRCDGDKDIPDYVTGSATSTLEAMIREVIDALGC